MYPLNYLFNGIKFLHTLVPPSPPPISGTSSPSLKLKLIKH